MKKLIAIIAAFVLAVMPLASAATEITPNYTVPNGYNAHDYQKLISFLELTDENGVKNGDKVSTNYNPNDPETLGNVRWTETSPKRLYFVGYFYNIVDVTDKLVGNLDLSGCTSLVTLRCSRNRISGINVSGCTSLEYLACGLCEINSLNLTGCSNLVLLWARYNELTQLDLSGCPGLDFVDCIGNRLTNIDLTHNPLLPVDRVCSVGSGYVGYASYLSNSEPVMPDLDDPSLGSAVYASPEGEAEFLGWYNAAGELVSSDQTFLLSEEVFPVLSARFSSGGGLPGDASGNGVVDVTDALLVLRYAMGIAQLPADAVTRCDVNGSGTTDVTDAIMILRHSMGLFSGF